MKKIYLALAGLCLPAVSLADPMDNLEAFYQNVTSFQAQFTQTVTAENGEVVDESTGQVAVDRPNRFYWDYLTPFRQEIVSDGQQMWLYDHDLAQMTVRPVSEGLAGTPLALLSGVALDEEFVIHPGVEDRYSWVNLYPLADDTDFERIRIGFNGSAPASMELHDQFGQTTRIEFIAPNLNAPVDQTLFDFNPPEGVEVVGVDY